MTFEKQFVEETNKTINGFIEELEKVDPNDYEACDDVFDRIFVKFKDVQSQIFANSESRGFSFEDICEAPVHLGLKAVIDYTEDGDIDNISKIIYELGFISRCLLVKEN